VGRELGPKVPHTANRHPPISPWHAGFACRCPACGEGRLFRGFLELVARCPVCGLDLGAADSGDGPAVFIILILGFVIVGLALVVEVEFEPPLWLHALIWPPLILGGALLLLRPFKATMVALQYKHKTHERGHGA